LKKQLVIKKCAVHRHCLPALVALLTVPPGGANAGPVADYFDSIDFNDYALSLNLYASESRYSGVPDTRVMYPLLSSFEHSATTTQPLFGRDAYLGLRSVAHLPWTYGVVTTVQADGFGPTSSDAVAGMESRGWTVAGGVMAGRELGRLRADLFVTTDLLREHGGQVYDLKFAWPLLWPNLQVVPQLEIAHYSEDYVDHYYGVRPEEVTAVRPAYSPAAANILTAGIHVAWRFRSNWFLRATVNFDRLPEEISASPLVDVDRGWRGSIGLAYDTGNFVRLQEGAPGTDSSSFDLSVEVFNMRAESVVVLPGSGPGAGGRLERNNNLDDRDTAFPVEMTWRLGRYHALGLRYFELFRNGTIELMQARQIGGRQFAAGSQLSTGLATRVLRADYGFAVFRDPQKELMVLAGVHATRFDYDLEGDGVKAGGNTNAILPLVGASLRANFTARLGLHVSAEMFLMDFDRYSGDLTDIAIEGRFRLADTIGLGAGFRWYRQSLDSSDDSLAGDLEIDYRGPFLRLTASF
jgi:MipA family protein